MKRILTNKKIESIEEILRSLNIPAPWTETRGPKYKYFFHTMRKGEIVRRPVSLKKARAIQTAMKRSAERQGFDVNIQNHGNYLLIRRNN